MSRDKVAKGGQTARDAVALAEHVKSPVDTTPAGVVKTIYNACTAINAARTLNEQMQAQFAPGSAQYAQCESIDDKLHDALAALGE